MSPLATSSTTDDDRDHHHQLDHDHHDHQHHQHHHSLDHLHHDQVLEPLDQDLNSVLSEAAQVEAALLLHHHRFATLGSIPHHQHEHPHEHQYTIDHTGIVENYPSASEVDSVDVDDTAYRDLEQEHHHDHHHHHHHHHHLDAYAPVENIPTEHVDLPRELSTGDIDKDELGAYPGHELDSQTSALNHDDIGLNSAGHPQELESPIGDLSENPPPKKKVRILGPRSSSMSTSVDMLTVDGNGQAVAGPSSSAAEGLANLDNGLSQTGMDKPVRKKGRVQVSNACTNCQKSRKKCSGDRPCTNCIGHPERICENSSRTARAKGIKRGPYKKKDRSDPRHIQNFPHIQSTYELYNSNPESATSDSHPSGSNSLSGSPVTDSALHPIHHPSNSDSLPNSLSVTSTGQTHHPPPTYETYDVPHGSRDTYAQIDVNGGQEGFTLVDSEDLNSQLIPLSLPSDHLSLNEESPMEQPPPPPPSNRSFLERLKEDVFGRKALMAATAAAALTNSGSGGTMMDPRLTSSTTHLDHDLLVSLASLPQEPESMHTGLPHSHLDPHQSSDQQVSQEELHHHSELSLDSLQEAQALSATEAESRQTVEAEAVAALSRRLGMDITQEQDQDQNQALDIEGQGQEVQEVMD